MRKELLLEKDSQFKTYWMKYAKHIIMTLVFVLIPLICCVFFCWMNGIGFKNIFTYGMAGNDEAIYQKMIEGIVDYGMPVGYFGYNESHANVGTFSTWSPFLLLNWGILGKIFGMQADSLIKFNILQLMFSMGLFYILAKPDIRKSLYIIAMYVAFLSITYNGFLMLPEINCYVFIIIFLGLFVNLRKTSELRKIKLCILFGIAILLTWMRPYYIVLLLMPSYELVKRCRKKKEGIIICTILFICTGLSYLWVYKNMCAPFFADLLNFSIMENIFSNPFGTMKGLLIIFLQSFRQYLQYVRGGILGDASFGCASAGILAVLVSLIFYFKKELHEKNYDEAIVTGTGIVFVLATYCAAAILFSIVSGNKHFLELIVLGIFVIGLKGDRKIVSFMIISLCWLCLLQIGNYSCIEQDDALVMWMEEGEKQLESRITVDPENDYWDNTIIWILDGTWWRGLYAVPSGMGINCCMADYVLDNWGNLQSRYLYTEQGGEVDIFCEKQEAILIAEYGSVHVWQLR